MILICLKRKRSIMTSSHDGQTGNGRRPFYISFIHVLVNWSGALSSTSVKMSNRNIELVTHVNLGLTFSILSAYFLSYFLSFSASFISNKPRSLFLRESVTSNMNVLILSVQIGFFETPSFF